MEEEEGTGSLFIGKNLIALAEVGSTNDYLKLLAEGQDLPEGTVVTAENQVAGRGQRGNTWESEAGQNIIMSALLYPGFLSPMQQFLLSQMVALAVFRLITFLLPEEKTAIKWPNDIYAGDKKIAGILIENALMGSQINYSIIGIGININQGQFNNPGAASVKMLSQKGYDLGDLYQLLFCYIEAGYFQLLLGAYTQIRKGYTDKLYRYNIEGKYIDCLTNETFTGVITGVTDGGKLIISTNNGTREFGMKEVGYL